MSEMWVKVASVVVVVVQWIWHRPCFVGQNVINCDSPVVGTNVFGDANDEPMDTGPSTRQRNSLGKCTYVPSLQFTFVILFRPNARPLNDSDYDDVIIPQIPTNRHADRQTDNQAAC